MIETINHINRQVAKNMGLDEDLVKAVNAAYWKEARATMSSGQHTSIYLKGFGTLACSRNKLRTKIKKLIKEIRYFQITDKEFKQKTREEYIKARTDELTQLLVLRDELATIYLTNKLRRDERILSKASMAKQTPDSNGNSEQILLSQGDQGDGQTEAGNM